MPSPSPRPRARITLVALWDLVVPAVMFGRERALAASMDRTSVVPA